MTIRRSNWLHLFLQVSWLTLILVALLELLGFLTDTFLGQGETFGSFSLGLLKKLAWSLPLCAVLALVMQRSVIMAITGLFTAPLATLFSSILDSQLRELWLNVTTDALSWASLQSAAFRGLEYGVLGAAIGFLTEKKRNGLVNHIYAGALTGLIFGGFVTYTRFQPGLNVAEVILQNVSEILFPVGCSIILKIVNR